MAKEKKKKKGKKGGKKKEEEKSQYEEEEYKAFNLLDVEGLAKLIPDLQEQLENIEVKRNYMQLERDTISTFYDITKKEVRELELEIMQKDREMEMMEENHNVEVRVYIQKVKHLEYEHKNNTNKVTDEGSRSKTAESGAHNMRKKILLQNKSHLKDKTKETQEVNAAEIKNMKELQKMNLDKLRDNFEANLEVTAERYEGNLAQLRQDLELRRKVEIHEIEERKNLHINDLMRNHEKAFTQIKNYYNDITKDNLKLIKALKSEVATMKKKAAKNKKMVEEISQENKRLMEPLGVAVHEVQHLTEALKDREKDTLALTNAKARANMLDKDLKRMRADHKDLQRKFGAVEKERDELNANFEETVRTVQRQSELKNLVLRKKTQTADEELMERQAQLQKVLAAAHLDPVVVTNLEMKLNDILDSRNGVVRDLQYEILRVSKAHDDAMRTLEERLEEFGIPHDEDYMNKSAFLGSSTTGPAGLVTAGI